MNSSSAPSFQNRLFEWRPKELPDGCLQRCNLQEEEGIGQTVRRRTSTRSRDQTARRSHRDHLQAAASMCGATGWHPAIMSWSWNRARRKSRWHQLRTRCAIRGAHTHEHADQDLGILSGRSEALIMPSTVDLSSIRCEDNSSDCPQAAHSPAGRTYFYLLADDNESCTACQR